MVHRLALSCVCGAVGGFAIILNGGSALRSACRLKSSSCGAMVLRGKVFLTGSRTGTSKAKV